MQKQLTEDQIAQARALRAEGKTYPEIQAAIGSDVAAGSIRSHCADVPVNGQHKTRTYQARQGKDGRTITPFTEAEDTQIIAWVTAGDGEETMAALAKRIDRKRHSVAARIKTLRKHGKLST